MGQESERTGTIMLVGMQDGVATLEGSLAGSYKTKQSYYIIHKPYPSIITQVN